jgi:hypothetical protein
MSRPPGHPVMTIYVTKDKENIQTVGDYQASLQKSHSEAMGKGKADQGGREKSGSATPTRESYKKRKIN